MSLLINSKVRRELRTRVEFYYRLDESHVLYVNIYSGTESDIRGYMWLVRQRGQTRSGRRRNKTRTNSRAKDRKWKENESLMNFPKSFVRRRERWRWGWERDASKYDISIHFSRSSFRATIILVKRSAVNLVCACVPKSHFHLHTTNKQTNETAYAYSFSKHTLQRPGAPPKQNVKVLEVEMAYG